jgi:hypothetical protein
LHRLDPATAYFVDIASTVDSAPVVTVRGWDGGLTSNWNTPVLEAFAALGRVVVAVDGRATPGRSWF